MVQPFKADDVDRCLVTTPGMLRKVTGVVALIEMCKYFKGEIRSKEKFHVTIGHCNIMADVYLFLARENDIDTSHFDPENSNFAKFPPNEIPVKLELGREFLFVQEMDKEKAKIEGKEVLLADIRTKKELVLAYLHFQKPIFVIPHSFYIGSRLDFQADSKMCRIAFSGRTLVDFWEAEETVPAKNLKLMSEKKKWGVVEKKFDDYTLIIKDMFKKETNFALFLGKEVYFEGTQVHGKLTTTFGSSGKVKVGFNQPVDSVLPNPIGTACHIVNKKFLKIRSE
jgi:selenocysteine-specific elongation factor